jgi:uncharacterized protein YndB with AHSA1/START domain
MSQRTLTHATLVMERTFKASPQRVFKAWENVEARERWQAPTPDVKLQYVEADFREGGRDLIRCYQANQLVWEGQTHYLDIRPNSRLVLSELVSGDGRHESVTMVGVEFLPVAEGTHQLLTLQITGFDGAPMEAGYQYGWNAALDNLAKEFSQ